MSASLYRAELALLVRATRVRWIVAALTTMISISFAIAWGDARQVRTETRTFQASERAR